MKNKKLFTIILQTTAQLSYLALSYFYFANQRPLSIWFATIFTTVAAYTLLLAFEHKWKLREIRLPMNGFIIGNSIYLLMDGNNLWAYVLAAAISIFGKWLFTDNQGRHIFNSSAFGIFVVSMLFPHLASSGLAYWNSSYMAIAVILFFGLIVTIRANRFMIAFSYQAGLILASMIMVVLARQTYPHFSFWIWPAGLLGVGPLMFTFHFITDPATSPDTLRGQIVFGGFIGVIQIALVYFGIVSGELIAYMLALVGFSLLQNSKNRVKRFA